ncbi:MAG TPA: hypothetical protein VLF69_00060 [Candidatus Saccharimonadales bacterium]|nr:hypothetical protein [Candidatus Saccharimonadales bacterium]
MADTPNLDVQAQVFTRYLVGADLAADVQKLYSDAMQKARLDAVDTRLLDFMLQHPWSIGMIDGGLVFYRPHSEVRRRLYVLLAILESNPEYTEALLPKKRSLWYMLAVGAAGVRAVVNAVVGSLLVRVLARGSRG